jgi:hypothetical protein
LVPGGALGQATRKRCSALSVDDIVPFDVIQQVIKVFFEDGASKVTELYDSFIMEIVAQTNALHEPIEVKDKTMSNECPLDQGRTFQSQLPIRALPAHRKRRMQASASRRLSFYLGGNRLPTWEPTHIF